MFDNALLLPHIQTKTESAEFSLSGAVALDDSGSLSENECEENKIKLFITTSSHVNLKFDFFSLISVSVFSNVASSTDGLATNALENG